MLADVAAGGPPLRRAALLAAARANHAGHWRGAIVNGNRSGRVDCDGRARY